MRNFIRGLWIFTILVLLVSVAYGVTIVTKDLLGKQDMKLFDRTGTNTFTRSSSTGATLTLNKIGTEVDVLQVYGGGARYTDATLSAAITAVGSNVVTFKLAPGNWAINSNITMPANATMEIPSGAVLVVAYGSKITINGPIQAGHWKIFTDNNTNFDGVSLGSPVKVANPEWFGAVGDGGTSDTNAFKSLMRAVAANGIPIDFSPGKTYLTGEISYSHNNLVINGNGSTWKTTASSYTLCNGTADFTSLTYYNLTGNPLVGDMSITLASAGDAANFTVGDFIYVRTGQTISDPLSAPHAQPVAEIAKIKSILGATLNLSWPLAKAFTGPIRFNSGGTAAIAIGDTVTGAGTGVSALVTYVILLSGSWAAGTAAGEIYVTGQTGTFGAENLNVGGKQDDIATIPYVYPHGVSNANSIILQNTHLKNIRFEHYNGRPCDLRNQYNCIVEDCIFDTVSALAVRGSKIRVRNNIINLIPNVTGTGFRPYYGADTGSSDLIFEGNRLNSPTTGFLHLHEGIADCIVRNNTFHVGKTESDPLVEPWPVISCQGVGWRFKIENNSIVNCPLGDGILLGYSFVGCSIVGNNISGTVYRHGIREYLNWWTRIANNTISATCTTGDKISVATDDTIVIGNYLLTPDSSTN